MDERVRALERCRLARAGDDLAWSELSPVPRGARRLTPGATRTFDTTGGVRTDGRNTLLLVGDSTLHALDARSLERTWSAPTFGHEVGAVSGPYLFHPAVDDGAAIDVRDLGTGSQVDRRPLPDGLRGWSVTASADRLAVACARGEGAGDALVVLDLSGTEPPRVLVEHREEGLPPVVRDVWLHANHPTRSATSARELTSGDVRWTSPGAPLRADSRSAFLLAAAGRSMQIDSVDVATGRTAWTHLVAADDNTSHAVGPDLFVVATTPPAWSKVGRERLDVDAVDRGTGDVRWSYQEQVGIHSIAAVAVTSDVVYVLHGPFIDPALAQRARPQTLLALDARTGGRLDSAAVPELPAGPVSLCPVEGAVLVVARARRQGTWIGRFGEN